jgi:uncharacterized membrane protein
VEEPVEAAQVRTGWRASTSVTRMLVGVLAGAVAAVVTGLAYRWAYAPIGGWIVAALTFELWAWLAVGRLDGAETCSHATREDPNRAITDLLLLGANVASLGAVGYVIIEAGNARTAIAQGVLAAVALLSVAVSWVLVQTLFTLLYARLYYAGTPGGVDFNDEKQPTYRDFAYLAYTMGMTYQVSDTNLQSSAFRAAVLRHALLSYVFGSVILATTINLVVGLSGR